MQIKSPFVKLNDTDFISDNLYMVHCVSNVGIIYYAKVYFTSFAMINNYCYDLFKLNKNVVEIRVFQNANSCYFFNRKYTKRLGGYY